MALHADDRGQAARRSVGSTTARVVAVVAAVALVAYTAHVLLLLFAGLLVGVLLDALAAQVSRWTGLGRRAGLALVLLLGAGLLTGLGFLVVPRVVEQVSSLAERLPEAWGSNLERLVAGRSSPVARVQEAVERADPSLVRPVVRSLSLTLAVVANVAIILVIGIYAAARPELYVEGFVHLLPHGWRDRAREVLSEAGRQLRRWMLGAILEMASAGVLIGFGLWLLEVPYALGLGVLAAALELVPNFGPFAAAVPALLLSIGEGNQATWWHVAVIYGVVQTVQSYLVQPLIQQYMVEVPPVLLIIVLLGMGWLLGALGLFVAVPTLVVAMVAVRLLYQRDVLGERVHVAT